MRISQTVAALVLVSCLSPARAAEIENNFHLTTPPRPVPPLVFEDADGTQHALADYRGRFVVLNVWAAWCAPCAHEMQSLDALQTDFDPRQVTVLPLSEDRGDAVVGAFYHSHAMTHLPVAIDTAGRAPSALHLPGLPTTLIIDPNGFEVARIEGGADWQSPQAIDFIKHQTNHN